MMIEILFFFSILNGFPVSEPVKFGRTTAQTLLEIHEYKAETTRGRINLCAGRSDCLAEIIRGGSQRGLIYWL